MPRKILIIEDEKFLLDMYKMKFERGGYEVIEAENGEEGLRLAALVQPDLILLDLIMSEIDGCQVLKRLKSGKKTKDLKVYVLSNLGQSDVINKGFIEGADGFMVKSDMTPTQLLKNVDKIFRGKTIGVKGISTPKSKRSANSRKKERKSVRILLIEDSEVIIDMYKLGFKKAGFTVEVAKNGIWGLKLAGKNKFDIIIMDMVMPAMNGRDAIKTLKKNEKTKNIPVIVLSNSAQDNDIKEVLGLGATSYLLKSQITPSRLIKEVEKALGKK